jgi:hypothetical protein
MLLFLSFVAGNDAAGRGCSATEGGDERAGVKRRDPFEIQLANARGERRGQGHARASVGAIRCILASAGVSKSRRKGKTMAKATSISLAKFTASVQAAVKGAVAKHPKFKVDSPQAVSISYLIRGFPVPETLLSQATIAETQAFAADVAASLGAAHPELLAPQATAEGAVISIGRHVIIGIPPVSQVFQLEK